MRYRQLGRTDMQVSVICQGGWSIAGGRTWGRQDRGDSVAAIRAALDGGINFFDTAEAYGAGESERIFGEVLAGRRKEVILATKVSRDHLRAEQVRRCCADSLRRLRTDYIDLYQVHWPSPDVPLAETMEAMEQLRAEGKVRAVGVSNFGAGYLAELLDLGRVEADQVCYSLLWRAVEHEVQPLCAANDVGICCYSPLCQGLLTGKFATPDDVPAGRARMRLFSGDRPESRHGEPGCEELTFEAIRRVRRIAEDLGRPMAQVALAWLLARAGVASVIAGGRNARQVRENAAAGDLELPSEAVQRLAEATDALKARVGANADLWQSDSRMERPA